MDPAPWTARPSSTRSRLPPKRVRGCKRSPSSTLRSPPRCPLPRRWAWTWACSPNSCTPRTRSRKPTRSGPSTASSRQSARSCARRRKCLSKGRSASTDSRRRRRRCPSSGRGVPLWHPRGALRACRAAAAWRHWRKGSRRQSRRDDGRAIRYLATRLCRRSIVAALAPRGMHFVVPVRQPLRAISCGRPRAASATATAAANAAAPHSQGLRVRPERCVAGVTAAVTRLGNCHVTSN
mmetsp:Transcript_28794/g.84382  ORF Transcript_28794/g.84382 Transcript_28794/m.84382 type:complete len:237 (-) Transcript_28794:36-746(-)